jgi:cell volume regulation protein A
MAGLPNGMTVFNVAFVVVIASLLLQGWTIAPAARFLGLELPPQPEPTDRRDIDLPLSADREAASWRVAPRAPVLEQDFGELHLPRRTRIIAVIRNGTVMNRETLGRLEVDDYVIALTPPQYVIALDRMFSTPFETRRRQSADLGEFVFNGDVPLGKLCAMYGVPFEPLMLDETLDQFMRMRLGGSAVVGDRVPIGPVELIVREVDKGRISRVGLEIEPAAERLPALRLLNRLKSLLRAR